MRFFERDRPRGGSEPDAVRGLTAGLIGGLAGSLAMAAFQGVASRAPGLRIEPTRFDVAADAVDGPDPCTEQAVQSLSRGLLGRELSERGKHRGGAAFHFTFGMGLGAVYGVLAEFVPLAAAGAGVPFGIAQAFVADDLAVPALGLSEPPGRAPESAHLLSLACHVVYGVTTEMIRRGVRARL